jgi:hypothetical protein
MLRRQLTCSHGLPSSGKSNDQEERGRLPCLHASHGATVAPARVADPPRCRFGSSGISGIYAVVMAHPTRIMWIECKGGDGLAGPARIGRVTFSKSGRSLCYDGKPFETLASAGSRTGCT